MNMPSQSQADVHCETQMCLYQEVLGRPSQPSRLWTNRDFVHWGGAGGRSPQLQIVRKARHLDGNGQRLQGTPCRGCQGPSRDAVKIHEGQLAC